MRRSILLLLVVSLFCSPLISSACAGQIQAKELSQTEAADMTALETDSATLIEAIEGGTEDPLVIAFAAIGILVLIAAAAA
jgi:hypothetical protein